MKWLPAVLFLMLAPLQAGDYPWSDAVPAEIAAASIIPDTVLDEIPCDWRPELTPLIKPLVKGCTTAREAVLAISTGLGNATGAYYSRERSKHNMNVLETLREKKISCTGQSILLVCALRSVGIPARAAGVLTWNHIPGNHTWAEAWFDGSWHMIEMGERDFNTPWVMENIGMLDVNSPQQRIMAATPSGNERWGMSTGSQPVQAEDVTRRYATLALKWYQQNGLSSDFQKLMVDIQPRSLQPIRLMLLDEKHNTIETAYLPTARQDMRYLTRMQLPRTGGLYFLKIQGSAQLLPISATPQPVQIIRLGRLPAL